MLLWFSFIVTLALTNFIKIARYLQTQDPDTHPTFLKALLSFFIGDNATTYSSVTIICTEFLFGAIYIDHVGGNFIPWLNSLSQHWAIAAFLGSISELAVPGFVKWAVSKFVP